MKIKKIVFFIIIITLILILNSSNVFASVAAKVIEIYNNTSLIISIIMKLIAFIVFILYVVFFIVYIINKDKKIKKLIKWSIIAITIILILGFGSEYVKKIGMTIKSNKPLDLYHEDFSYLLRNNGK